MNTERLHFLALMILDDMKSSNLEKQLNNLEAALQNIANNPAEAAHQQELKNSLGKLQTILAKSISNDSTPALQQTAAELGILQYLGNRLLGEINSILSQNQITPSVGLQEFKKLRNTVKDMTNNLSNLTTSFDFLNIEAEELEPGQCELGILIPRKYVKNELTEFSKELAQINKILSVFSEIATGSRPPFQIRTISSSDLTILLDIAPDTAAYIAVAIERIVALYKSLLEIRKLHQDLKDKNVPDDKIQGIRDYANEEMQKGIDVLANELINESTAAGKITDKGRTHEVQTELKFSLNQIANRIDQGFNIEIRVEPLPPPEEASGEAPAADGGTYTPPAYVSKIQGATKNMGYIRTDGSPILSLPETDPKKR